MKWDEESQLWYDGKCKPKILKTIESYPDRLINKLSREERNVFIYKLGHVLLRSPIVATLMGHTSASSTLADYFLVNDDDPLADQLVAKFFHDFCAMERGRISVAEMAARWSPSQEEAMEQLDRHLKEATQ